MVVEGSIVRVGDRDLRLTNLDKVLYPATGTTKGDVIAYYRRIYPVMLPLLAGRPVTRKRWPNGVESPAFFTKDADSGTPEWVRRVQIQHSGRVAFYPVAEHEADLAWFGQAAALELHVPQWKITGAGPVDVTHRTEWLPDRVVIDLDPGIGAGLPECVQVAQVVRQILGELGEKILPVTSGSKGLHLYIPLDGPISSDDATTWAKQIAEALVRRLPTLVTATMTKSLRAGNVFIDWSQNTGAKTSIAPYSLRGRDRPTVAAPRTWAELDRPDDLEHLDLHEVLARLDAEIEPFSSHPIVTAPVDEPPARERTTSTRTRTSPPPRKPAPRPGARQAPATGSPRPVGRRRPPMQPMLATPGTTTDVRGAGWQVEGKWDGIRALVTVDEHGLAIQSRNGNDVTATFPELSELSTLLPGHTAPAGDRPTGRRSAGVPPGSLGTPGTGRGSPRCRDHACRHHPSPQLARPAPTTPLTLYEPDTGPGSVKDAGPPGSPTIGSHSGSSSLTTDQPGRPATNCSAASAEPNATRRTGRASSRHTHRVGTPPTLRTNTDTWSNSGIQAGGPVRSGGVSPIEAGSLPTRTHGGTSRTRPQMRHQ